MTSRRSFLKFLGAGTLAPTLTWADMGSPAYLAAARRPTGAFALFGLDSTGHDLFSVALPDRAHSAAVHPRLAQATVFARRPGTYAVVLDCTSGKSLKTIKSPDGFYFCGHGAYDASGSRLYTTETEISSGEGRIGVWDVPGGFERITALSSGGIGPHECILVPGNLLAVANGSLETGLDGKADPISIAEMRPNLTYIDLSSEQILQTLELEGEMRRNSIRHLAIRPDGLLAFAMQWHGSELDAPPLLGLHRVGEASARLLTASEPEQRRLKGYAGSVAFSGDGKLVGISSPHGGMVDVFTVESAHHAWRDESPDLCGLASHDTGFAATTGLGDWLILSSGSQVTSRLPSSERGRAWDNHMVALRI